MPTTLKFFRRNLTHWLVADRSYFVTLRLHGTLPGSIGKQLREEREALLREEADTKAMYELHRRQFAKLEGILDSIHSNIGFLNHPDVARSVMKSLEWFKKVEWKVYAAVIMPSHIHLLMRNEAGRTSELLKDLGHFKRYTARKANQILGRSGAFWAREGFDHWIRDHAKFESVIRYIVNNPVKAGLASHWQDWPWYYLDDSIRELI